MSRLAALAALVACLLLQVPVVYCTAADELMLAGADGHAHGHGHGHEHAHTHGCHGCDGHGHAPAGDGNPDPHAHLVLQQQVLGADAPPALPEAEARNADFDGNSSVALCDTRCARTAFLSGVAGPPAGPPLAGLAAERPLSRADRLLL